MKHISFEIVNAVTDLLKIEKHQRWKLIDLLSNRFNKREVEKAIDMALSIKVIKVPGLIRERNFDKTTYMLVV